ncbi:MAG: CopG family transcriptional regulator [Thermodesulfobacteriota bacterium]
MKRSTIFLDEQLETDIKYIAKVKKRKVSHIIREALFEYVAKEKQSSKPSFIGIGSSGIKNISETHEETLFES